MAVRWKWLGAMALLWALTGCATGVPDGLQPVSGFDIQRYQGQWYEVARLDHRFERGLSDVTATYRVTPDGSVRVLNRGYDVEKARWREAEGVARWLGDAQTASLKVSFFGPFYGGYHVIALDPGYRWAMVAGPDRSYLWLLAREPQLDQAVRQRLLVQAHQSGFDTDRLIWVAHGKARP